MSVLDAEVELLNRQAKKVFFDLEGHGFQFKAPLVKHTNAIGDYVEIEITHEVTGKSLLIAYAPALDLRPESISVFLQNIDGDTFSISDYLSYKKFDSQLRKSVSLANHHGSLSERIEMTLVASREIILTYLEDVLLGSGWEFIPINWGDMK